MDEVAAAIADPIRRAILEMLRDGRLTAGEIAGRFDISRPAISRHLRVLRESGLVRDELSGRRRYYELDIEPLGELAGWIARLGVVGRWEQRLDALATEVHRTRRDRRQAADSARASASLRGGELSTIAQGADAPRRARGVRRTGTSEPTPSTAPPPVGAPQQATGPASPATPTLPDSPAKQPHPKRSHGRSATPRKDSA